MKADDLEKYRKLQKRLKKAVSDTVDLMVGDSKKSIQTPSQGRVYKRGKKTHTSSQAGKPPNIDTGALLRSIKKQRVGDHLFEWGSYGLTYSYALEYGYPKRNLEPRPFIAPSVAKFKDVLITRLQKAISGGEK